MESVCLNPIRTLNPFRMLNPIQNVKPIQDVVIYSIQFTYLFFVESNSLLYPAVLCQMKPTIFIPFGGECLLLFIVSGRLPTCFHPFASLP